MLTAQRGDAGALDAFARLCFACAYRWALARSTDCDEAEDVAQQVTISAVQRLRGFRFAAKPTTWLYGITRHVLADGHRTRARRKALLAQNTDSHAATQPNAQLRLLAEFVREQLGGLPARQREIFDLVDLQGWPASEVAEAIGLDQATVRVHLLRARRALRARILDQRAYLYQEVADGL